MKFISSDQRGFSHDILIVAVVAITVIGGVGFMVASHANSGVLGSKVSRPTSSPTSSLKKITHCEIKNVPKTPRHGSVIKPTLYFYNKELTTQSPDISMYLDFYNNKVKGPSSSESYGGMMRIKSTSSMKTSKSKLGINYSVPYRSDEKVRGVYTVDSGPSSSPRIQCSAVFTLPKEPKNKKASPAPTQPTGPQHGIIGG